MKKDAIMSNKNTDKSDDNYNFQINKEKEKKLENCFSC